MQRRACWMLTLLLMMVFCRVRLVPCRILAALLLMSSIYSAYAQAQAQSPTSDAAQSSSVAPQSSTNSNSANSAAVTTQTSSSVNSSSSVSPSSSVVPLNSTSSTSNSTATNSSNSSATSTAKVNATLTSLVPAQTSLDGYDPSASAPAPFVTIPGAASSPNDVYASAVSNAARS